MAGSGQGSGTRDALWALADELQRRGCQRIYARACERVGVLSVCLGLTVWCHRDTLVWCVRGEVVTWPAADPLGAAARLAASAPFTASALRATRGGRGDACHASLGA
jgi:hypothetical protein